MPVGLTMTSFPTIAADTMPTAAPTELTTDAPPIEVIGTSY